MAKSFICCETSGTVMKITWKSAPSSLSLFVPDATICFGRNRSCSPHMKETKSYLPLRRKRRVIIMARGFCWSRPINIAEMWVVISQMGSAKWPFWKRHHHRNHFQPMKSSWRISRATTGCGCSRRAKAARSSCVLFQRIPVFCLQPRDLVGRKFSSDWAFTVTGGCQYTKLVSLSWQPFDRPWSRITYRCKFWQSSGCLYN